MSGTARVVINGRFFDQRITGVQRYAREMVNALDALALTLDIEIVVPDGTSDVPAFSNIRVVTLPKCNAQLWDWVRLPRYVGKRDLLVNLCNVASPLRPGVTVVHDITYKVNRDFHASWRDRLVTVWNLLNYHVAFKYSKAVVTDSEFSKSEILAHYPVPRDSIHVVYCGWEHVRDCPVGEMPDGLEKRCYYFSMSTLAENKNFKWVLASAKANPGSIYVVAGSRKIAESLDPEYKTLPNVRYLGRVDDSQAKALMKNCKAFLFPSLYEGFGLTPLEAIACGAPAIAISDIPCMREIYGDAAVYIDPLCLGGSFDVDTFISDAQRTSLLERFSWAKSATRLIEIVNEVIAS